MSGQSVLTIGNLTQDTVFTVDRIPNLDETGLVQKIEEYYGGRAGNIAVICSVLGLDTAVASIVGQEWTDSGYKAHLLRLGVNVDRVKVQRGKKSARIFLFKQMDGKHVYFFKPNVHKNSDLNLSKYDFKSFKAVYMSSFNSEKRVMKLLKEFRESFIIFGLGEEIYRKPACFLKNVVHNSDFICANHVESKVFLKKLGLESLEESFRIGERLRFLCISKGSKGSTIFTSARKLHFPAVPAATFTSALGAGDAYVAGIIYGLVNDWEIETCGKFGSVLSSFILESDGAQNRLPKWQEIRKRYLSYFGKPL